MSFALRRAAPSGAISDHHSHKRPHRPHFWGRGREHTLHLKVDLWPEPTPLLLRQSLSVRLTLPCTCNASASVQEKVSELPLKRGGGHLQYGRDGELGLSMPIIRNMELARFTRKGKLTFPLRHAQAAPPANTGKRQSLGLSVVQVESCICSALGGSTPPLPPASHSTASRQLAAVSLKGAARMQHHLHAQMVSPLLPTCTTAPRSMAVIARAGESGSACCSKI